MPIFRYPRQIQVVDLTKGYKKPKTEAQNSKDRMMTGDGFSPMPTKPDQASASGVKCGRCGHHHAAGNICSFNKSSLDGLFDYISKADDSKIKSNGGGEEDVKEAAEATSTGVKGHKGGNPYHDEKGRFTTKDGAASKTTGAGEGAVSVDKDKPNAGSGRGSDMESLFDLSDDDSTGAAKVSAAGGKVSGSEGDGGGVGQATPDPKEAWAAKKQEVMDDIESMKQAGVDPKMVREYGEQSFRDAAYAADPQSFEGGVITPRAERAPYAPGPGGVAMGKDDDAHELASRSARLRAQKQARQDILDAGGDDMDAALAGQQAWKDTDNAYNEARMQGIPADQVAGQEKQLAAAWNQRQGIETVMPGASPTQEMGAVTQPMAAQPDMSQPMAQTQQMGAQTAMAQGTGQTLANVTPESVVQAKQPGVDGSKTYSEPQENAGFDPTKTYKQEPQDMSDSMSQYDKLQQRKKYDKTYNEARKHGFSHEDAHAAASEHSGANWEAGEDTWGQDGGKPDSKDKQGLQIPGVKTSVTGKEPKKQALNVPFGQLYSQGQAIGSGMTTPGGTVNPTGGLAAQRAHSLLNPYVRPKQSQRLPHMGTTDKRRTVGTKDVSRTSMDKSLERLFDL